MPTLVKTPTGSWKAVVRRNGWPTLAKTFRIKRDAEDWARRTEDEMVRALDRYEREVVPLKKTTTQRGEKTRVRELKQHLGRYALSAVSPDVVSAFRDKRLAQGKANNTVRLELALLGHMFTNAIREWHIGLTYNPVVTVRKPSPGPGRNRRFVGEEQARLFAAVDSHSNPMLGWIVRLAIETGMRQSEILHLRCDQVDRERRVLRLADTKNGSARTVPLTKSATEVITAALANPTRPPETKFVFFGEPGRMGDRKPYQFTKVWQTIRRRLGLTDLRFHDLRHEAVSRLVEAGLSDQEVSAISGHKSMQMLKRYTHLRGEDLVERLDRIAGPR